MARSPGRSSSTVVPEAASYIFFLALLAMVAGGVAALRGPAMGPLAALVASPALVHEVPAWYADVPLACYLAGAVVFALLEQPVIAGISWAASRCGPSTKERCSCLYSRLRCWCFGGGVSGRLRWGQFRCLRCSSCFKGALARGNGSSLLAVSLPGAKQRLSTWSPYGTIARAFEREFANLGLGWYHPLVPGGGSAGVSL